MDAETIVRETIAAYEAGNVSRAGQYLTDDFTFSGPTPEPVGKTEFLGLMGGLLEAFPDWRFNAKNFKVQGNKVTFTTKVTGTHTDTLDTHIPGIPPVPATNKKITMPEEPNIAILRGDKIASFELTPVPGGGVAGILSQLGVSAMH